jgi:hypothetical protein
MKVDRDAERAREPFGRTRDTDELKNWLYWKADFWHVDGKIETATDFSKISMPRTHDIN